MISDEVMVPSETEQLREQLLRAQRLSSVGTLASPINFAAVKDFEPQVYTGDVTLFLASDLTSDYDLRDGWRELVRGKIETHEISGNHINIIKEPHVGALAAQLRECIMRSDKESKTA